MALPPADPFPGWRVDPAVPHSERFWDGRQWTEKLRPVPRPITEAGVVGGPPPVGPSRAEIATPDGITIVADPPALPVEPAIAAVPVPRPQLAELPPPAPNTLAERAVLRPIPVPAMPTRAPAQAPPSRPAAPSAAAATAVSIFTPSSGPSREHDGDFFTVARRVQLPATVPPRRVAGRRVDRLRTVAIAAACLVVGVVAGFAAGSRVAADDPSGEAPISAAE